MGVMCKISVDRPPSGIFRPGYDVTGVVKFAVDEKTSFNDVIIKLVGSGSCHWRESKPNSDDSETDTYRGSEEYVSIKNKILNKSGEVTTVPIGSYEQRFAFVLPDNIPSSHKDLYCTIKYQIKVKFHRPGLLRFAKEFTTDIQVKEYARQEILTGPIIYGLEKKLFKLFSSKTNIYLRTEIEQSMLAPDQNANLKFFITNDTKVIIPSVEVRLACETKYTADCGRTKTNYSNPDPAVNTSSIPDHAEANLSLAFPIGMDHMTMNNSKILSRSYKLKVTIKLPLPHLNATRELPIMIGEVKPVLEVAKEAEEMIGDRPPPTYWEAMQETDKIS